MHRYFFTLGLAVLSSCDNDPQDAVDVWLDGTPPPNGEVSSDIDPQTPDKPRQPKSSWRGGTLTVTELTILQGTGEALDMDGDDVPDNQFATLVNGAGALLSVFSPGMTLDIDSMNEGLAAVIDDGSLVIDVDTVSDGTMLDIGFISYQDEDGILIEIEGAEGSTSGRFLSSRAFETGPDDLTVPVVFDVDFGVVILQCHQARMAGDLADGSLDTVLGCAVPVTSTLDAVLDPLQEAYPDVFTPSLLSGITELAEENSDLSYNDEAALSAMVRMKAESL